MANFVSNRVICKRSFYEKYFYDTNPFGMEKSNEYVKEKSYITFNKLYKVKSLNEYMEKYGEYIYYGYGYNVKQLDNDLVEIKFQTKWSYPICAIVKAIELNHSIIWYAIEENIIYYSKFSWKDNKVIEETLYIENDKCFEAWYGQNIFNNLKCYDDSLWYYNYENNPNWKRWDTDDLVKRYKDIYPPNNYQERFKE